VVNEVIEGRADAGAVRTGVLEQLTREGKLDLSEIRVLNRRKESDFPFLLSSELYPEFAFLGTGHVSRELATQVTAELLVMPHDSSSGYTLGWSIPENYHKVQQLMQKWRMHPYEQYGKVTLREAARQHPITVVLALAVSVACALILHLVLTLRNRRRKYAVLREAKQNLDLLNAMTSATPDAVLIRDVQGYYRYLNPAAEFLVGKPAVDLVGRSGPDLFTPVPCGSEPCPPLPCGICPPFEVELSQEGGVRFLQVIRGPMYDEEGRIDGSFLVARDITDLKRLQGEVSRKVEELEEALSKVRQLEGIIPICSYCHKIRDDAASWQQLEQYITDHSGASFSHGICPECYDQHLQSMLDPGKD